MDSTQSKKWQKETQRLRKISLECELLEQSKWGKPCFMLEDKNVVLIQGFKDYVALLFFKGALLKDPKHILVRPGANTQAGRQLRFADITEIIDQEAVVKRYILEAIAVEKEGLTVPMKEVSEFAVPEEFQAKVKEVPALKKAFDKLTPGRRRAYLLFFAGAKQSQTRLSRIEKCMPQILAGKGLND